MVAGVGVMAGEPRAAAGVSRARFFLSSTPRATEDLGAALGARLVAGTTLALRGELGAGKTTFVRGLARGLEVPGTISSPTYALMHEHQGRLPLYHFDAWMEGREKAYFLDGGDEALASEGVSVIEWADRVLDFLPLPRLEVHLEHGWLLENPARHAQPHGPSEERRIRIEVVGVEGEPGTLGRLLAQLESPGGVLEQPPSCPPQSPPDGREPSADPSVGRDS